MPDDHPKLRAAVRASQRVQDAEERLESARQGLYDAVRDAQAAGVSLSALARAFGVSRQAVQKMLNRR